MEKKEEKKLETEQVERSEHRAQDDGVMTLDDSQRVKVLSPGAMVFKRFVRNKLAIVGVCILVSIFLFSFIGPLFYPYGQTQVFTKYDYINAHYGGITVRSDFVAYTVDSNVTISDSAKLMINSDINALNKAETDSLTVERDGSFVLNKLGEKVYTLSAVDYKTIATYSEGYLVGSFDNLKKAMKEYAPGVAELGADFDALVAEAVKSNNLTFKFDGKEYTVSKDSKMASSVKCSSTNLNYTGAALADGFEDALKAALEAGDATVTFDGSTYNLSSTEEGVAVNLSSGEKLGVVATTLVFDTDEGITISDELRNAALLNAYSGDSFQVEGVTYAVETDDEGLMTLVSDGTVIANMTNFAIRDVLGGDTMSLEFKAAAAEAVSEMGEMVMGSITFSFPMEKVEITTNEEGMNVSTVVLDESGNPVIEDMDITINQETAGQYKITCPQLRYLIDINAAPSSEHILGTDANGMDTMARLMYGGRISMMVGFIVVFLELILGVIMGGIAGYFGGWVDTLIMRLVDIFRCIPSMPILIILASFMDAQQVDAYVRLMYMMAVLGILGWAGIARLVRGQILSLREQEFMTAAEATGIRVRRRIFQHLVPNVMPQLIVISTSSLGGIILTESTLSFLGLGVKFPMATWGNIINTVTKTNENLMRYTYIWIPVGMLICLTVIAFNFVGDGLRDAFDPKMKR